MKTDKKSLEKEAYAAPTIEVIHMESEGVIASSSLTEGYGDIEPMSYRANRSYGAASGSDLEDLINDILTVEN